ncbi:sensor histidine kinase [Streptomyces neyagawaensis]|uniref:sensor histidine kinase n=2 Tax=Streptomyces neyagawaensis TaxID=42238 RepID=UPI00201CB67C|nr:histidine kinase [Streptomyces neyagawaensis]MCL6737840.1 histidine kinase [Streptomyces neyagawaensis]MDE1684284.1 histidine kinase [Streptomyces neyagawaensis]
MRRRLSRLTPPTFLSPVLTPVPLPRPSRWMWTADATLALLLAVCTVVTALRQGTGTILLPPGPLEAPLPGAVPAPPVVPSLPGAPPESHLVPVHAWQLILAALTALPLAVRRRWPLAAFWAVTGAALLFNQRLVAGDTTVYTFLSCVIAAYSAAVHSPHRLGAIASLVAGAGLIAAYPEENFPYLTPSVIPFVALLGVGLGANAIHTWKQRVHALKDEQETATRLAVDRERSRIAAELHDVVTHNVSVMVIQAGAARKVMDAAPDHAREALLAVEASGRTAMSELRHVMHLLTMTTEALDGSSPVPAPTDPALSPQPGLADVPALVDRVRGTGVPVDLTVTAAPSPPSPPSPTSPLPPGADLAAYRVVQEALTNAVKHAAGARVAVTVEHTPTAVRVEVTDTGGTPAPEATAGTRRGLLGLRERLAVNGGTLSTGPRPTGGYRVEAVIPRNGTEKTP